MKERFNLYLGLLILLFFFSGLQVKSQAPAYRQFTDDDGLPSMTVYGIKQDKDGFLWIATVKGICRFDGKEFKKYFIPDMKGQDFPYIFMDETGTPWFYNLAGEVFYVKDDTVRRFDLINRIEGGRIASFFSYDNNVYITWDLNNSLSSNVYKKSESSNIKELYQDISFLGIVNNKLIGIDLYNCSDSIKLIDVKSNLLLFSNKLPANSIQKFSSDFNILRVLNDGKILVLSSYYSCILDSNFKVIKEIEFDLTINEKIIYTSIINDVELFIKTNSRSFKLNLVTNTIKLINNFGNSINTVFEDQLRRTWLTTTNRGIFFSYGDQCLIFNSNNSPLASDEVFVIFADQENILFGHEIGVITSFNLKTGTWKTLNCGNSNRIRSILSVDFNYIVATDNELFIIDKINLNIRKITNINFTGIKNIQIDFSNKLYMLTRLGTTIINLNYINSKYFQHSFQDLIIDERSICGENYKGGLLVGTSRGIFFCNDTSVVEFGKSIIGNNYINSISVFKDSICFVSTDNNGVYIIRDTSIIDSINTINGLPSNSVSTVVLFNNIISIIGTDKGCFVYNLNDKQGYVLNKLDGLPSNEVLDLFLVDSTLWVSTPNGVAKFQTNKLSRNIEAPSIRIQRIDVFSSNGVKHSLENLNYSENYIKINLLIRSLVSDGKYFVYYKLHDVDSSWYRTTLPYIDLIGLEPGEYQLSINVKNEDGVYSMNTLRIEFSIGRPWWKEIWFNVLFVTTIIIISVIVTAIKFINIRRSERKLNDIFDQINELKLQALQIQMNPHFIFNSLNAIQGFLGKNDENTAMLYMSKFASLIRIIFEQSKCKFITLEDEINLLNRYIELEEIRVGKIFSVLFEVDYELNENMKFITIPPLLVQPVVENSFRHGLYHSDNRGLLKIKFNKVGNSIVCVVEDNGIGRQLSKKINKWKNKNHVSTGIASAVERLMIIDKNSDRFKLDIEDIVDSTGLVSGTRVTIYLAKYL
ncbi:MAG TPA: histidine kinase [Saprospiraceae bacterium]|nr:histidine kinase [Saprospiraceae bacterium]